MSDTVTEEFASWLSSFELSDVSSRMREVALLDLVDAAGLCVAAAPEIYAKQLISSWERLLGKPIAERTEKIYINKRKE